MPSSAARSGSDVSHKAVYGDGGATDHGSKRRTSKGTDLQMDDALKLLGRIISISRICSDRMGKSRMKCPSNLRPSVVETVRDMP